MIATVTPSNNGCLGGGREGTTRLSGGELLVKPDIAVFKGSVVLALGETKQLVAHDACVRLLYATVAGCGFLLLLQCDLFPGTS